eukprot:m.129070 g.129070  ORF g.129070 m.129070 type:complete len:66 (+) comp15688_c5_seq3:576-773(+)
MSPHPAASPSVTEHAWPVHTQHHARTASDNTNRIWVGRFIRGDTQNKTKKKKKTTFTTTTTTGHL